MYVYALIDAPIAIDDVPVPGVSGEALRVVPGPACWVVTGMMDAAIEPEPSAANLRAQDAVVRAIAARAEAVLPMRFGSVFENETALQIRLSRFTVAQIRN